MIPDNSDIVGSFPNPTIDLIIGLPTYETINSIPMNLNQNSASVDLHLWDFLNGLLPLTVSLDIYNTLSTIPFAVLTNPIPHDTGTGTAIQLMSNTLVRTKNTLITI